MSFPKNHLFPEIDQQTSIAGRTLGHPARIYILKYLREHGPKQFTELVKALPLTDGTVTAHLKKLLKQGLIEVVERGLVNIYMLNPIGVEEVFDLQDKLYTILGGERVHLVKGGANGHAQDVVLRANGCNDENGDDELT